MKSVQLGSLAEIKKGKRVRSSDSSHASARRLIQIKDLRSHDEILYVGKDSRAISAAVGDVLIAWDGANAGTVGWGLEGYIGSTLARLRVGSDVLPEYLGWYLRFREKDIRKAATGATIPHVNGRFLKSMTVPLPALGEQRRIVAILDQAGTIRSGRRRALDRIDALPAALYGNLSAMSNATMRLGDIAEVRGGKRLPKGASYAGGRTKYPYIRVSDMHDGRISLGGLRYLDEETHEKLRRYVVGPEDVIISIAGSIGATASVPECLAGAHLTENAARIAPIDRSSPWSPAWMKMAIQSRPVQEQIRRATGQVTIGKLALFRIEGLRVPIPPLETQRKFSEGLEVIDSMRQKALDVLQKDNELFASLQSRAFRGEL